MTTSLFRAYPVSGIGAAERRLRLSVPKRGYPGYLTKLLRIDF
jgi:hypothetical protein